MASKLLITPYQGSVTAGQNPTIAFQGPSNSTDITLKALDAGDLQIAGSAGTLLTITNSLTGGTVSTPSLNVSGVALHGGYSQIASYSSIFGIKFPGGGTQYGLAMQPTTDSTKVLSIFNAAGTYLGGIDQTSTAVTWNGSMAASGLTGTIPSTVLGNSTVYIGTTAVALNRTSASLSLTGVSIDGNAGTVTNGVYTTSQYLGVSNTTSTNGYGLSLYNGAVAGQPTYGIMFQGTATFGTHGQVSADWATYFTMNNTANRGWIFRDVSTPANVASISNAGHMTLSGQIDVGSHIYARGDLYSLNSAANGWNTVLSRNSGTHNLYANNFYAVGDNNTYLTNGALFLRSASPTIYFRDTDGNSAMLHNNGNLFYVLRGANDTTTWTQVNTQWPVYWDLTTNNATFGGAVYAVGNVTAYSDIKLKENIETVDSALAKTLQLRGVYYTRKDDPEKCRRIGVIAQEVQEVVPEVVKLHQDAEDKEGTLSVDYGNLAGLFIEAIKEQQKQIEQLQNEIKELKNAKL